MQHGSLQTIGKTCDLPILSNYKFLFSVTTFGVDEACAAIMGVCIFYTTIVSLFSKYV